MPPGRGGGIKAQVGRLHDVDVITAIARHTLFESGHHRGRRVVVAGGGVLMECSEGHERFGHELVVLVQLDVGKARPTANASHVDLYGRRPDGGGPDVIRRHGRGVQVRRPLGDGCGERRIGHNALEVPAVRSAHDGEVLRELDGVAAVAEGLDGGGVAQGAHEGGIRHGDEASSATGDVCRLDEREATSMNTIPHFIGGQRRTDGDSFGTVFDPATGREQAQVPFADEALLEETLTIARAAAAKWRLSTLSQRTNVLFTFRQLLTEHANDLAALITAEHGKTTPDALGELARGLENVEYACGLADHLKGEFSHQVADGVDVHSVHEPVGIVAAITPFNFPVMVPLWMTANALAAGNAVVLKPSERDPSGSVLLAELLQRAGLPDGVFNVIHGNADTVRRLLVHPQIDAVSFVGSTPVAKFVYETGTSAGKRVQALGGAKNHMLVLPDADLDVAADAAINAGYGSAGERCMAVSVVVAHEKIADELVARIAERTDRLTVGPGTDPQSDFGPLITREHRDRVASYVTNAPSHGATVVRDGTALVDREGFFVGPCLIDHVVPGTPAYDDEIFGPVLSVVRVSSYDDAVALINANPYGNGVAIFTRDGNAARLFSRDVTVGMIGVNVPIPVPVASYSFGGWKDSLFGHSHIYGPDGIAFYTRAKVVTTRWPQPSDSQIDLGFPRTR